MILLVAHIASGTVAIATGAVAASVAKGSSWHARAGTAFCAAMLGLGVSTMILGPQAGRPGDLWSGLLVCYFTATAWMTARRHDGRTARFERFSAAALLVAAAMLAGALGSATTPVGKGPVFAIAAICSLAGLLDVNAVMRSPLSPPQRHARHAWRVLFAFFIATGSFFIGQQKVLPAQVRGSPVLLALGFLPLVLMIFWLVRLRWRRRAGRRAAMPAAG